MPPERPVVAGCAGGGAGAAWACSVQPIKIDAKLYIKENGKIITPMAKEKKSIVTQIVNLNHLVDTI